MGINGLLPQVKSISHPTHVKTYRGKKVAVDGYSWLHKGAYCCARELCEGTYTDKFVTYFLSRVEPLRSCGVEVLIIFDGCRLPMKANEEDSRRKARTDNLDKARGHVSAGNMAAANECYQRAAGVTSAMVKQTIEALKAAGVDFLVAPYEADAQLCYMALHGGVHAVITEDSDLLAYGCPRVLFKLDKTGIGEEVCMGELALNKGVNFDGFTPDMFLAMCILSGCDFLPNVPGLGPKKAHQAVRKCRTFSQVVRSLRFSGTSVPRDYEQRFQRVVWLFRHQRVFDRATQTLVHLRPLPPGGVGAADVEISAAVPEDEEERVALPFLGPPMENAVAAGIARGDLDPRTLEPYDLAAVYRGCTHPPHHLRAALGWVQPTRSHSMGHSMDHGLVRSHSHSYQQQHQQQHSNSQHSRPHSWGGRSENGVNSSQKQKQEGRQQGAPVLTLHGLRQGGANTAQQSHRPSTGSSKPLPIPTNSISSYFAPAAAATAAFNPPRPHPRTLSAPLPAFKRKADSPPGNPAAKRKALVASGSPADTAVGGGSTTLPETSTSPVRSSSPSEKAMLSPTTSARRSMDAAGLTGAAADVQKQTAGISAQLSIPHTSSDPSTTKACAAAATAPILTTTIKHRASATTVISTPIAAAASGGGSKGIGSSSGKSQKKDPWAGPSHVQNIPAPGTLPSIFARFKKTDAPASASRSIARTNATAAAGGRNGAAPMSPGAAAAIAAVAQFTMSTGKSARTHTAGLSLAVSPSTVASSGIGNGRPAALRLRERSQGQQQQQQQRTPLAEVRRVDANIEELVMETGGEAKGHASSGLAKRRVKLLHAQKHSVVQAEEQEAEEMRQADTLLMDFDPHQSAVPASPVPTFSTPPSLHSTVPHTAGVKAAAAAAGAAAAASEAIAGDGMHMEDAACYDHVPDLSLGSMQAFDRYGCSVSQPEVENSGLQELHNGRHRRQLMGGAGSSLPGAAAFLGDEHDRALQVGMADDGEADWDNVEQPPASGRHKKIHGGANLCSKGNQALPSTSFTSHPTTQLRSHGTDLSIQQLLAELQDESGDAALFPATAATAAAALQGVAAKQEFALSEDISQIHGNSLDCLLWPGKGVADSAQRASMLLPSSPNDDALTALCTGTAQVEPAGAGAALSSVLGDGSPSLEDVVFSMGHAHAGPAAVVAEPASMGPRSWIMQGGNRQQPLMSPTSTMLDSPGHYNSAELGTGSGLQQVQAPVVAHRARLIHQQQQQPHQYHVHQQQPHGSHPGVPAAGPTGHLRFPQIIPSSHPASDDEGAALDHVLPQTTACRQSLHRQAFAGALQGALHLLQSGVSGDPMSSLPFDLSAFAPQAVMGADAATGVGHTGPSGTVNAPLVDDLTVPPSPASPNSNDITVPPSPEDDNEDPTMPPSPESPSPSPPPSPAAIGSVAYVKRYPRIAVAVLDRVQAGIACGLAADGAEVQEGQRCGQRQQHRQQQQGQDHPPPQLQVRTDLPTHAYAQHTHMQPPSQQQRQQHQQGQATTTAAPAMTATRMEGQLPQTAAVRAPFRPPRMAAAAAAIPAAADSLLDVLDKCRAPHAAYAAVHCDGITNDQLVSRPPARLLDAHAGRGTAGGALQSKFLVGKQRTAQLGLRTAGTKHTTTTGKQAGKGGGFGSFMCKQGAGQGVQRS